MKGIILAGGKGTRLYPLTRVTNKHLLPVGKEPMIYNPIKQLVSCDIKEILIVTSKEHMGSIVNLLGSGKEFDCDFTFKVQEDALGVANALLLAENFANGDLITVLLGDNITTHSIRKYVEEFKNKGVGAKVLLHRVTEPERYGIATIDEMKIIKIDEKPKNSNSDLAVVGIYMYDSQVFDIIRTIPPSIRGEYEITAVNNVYIEKGQLSFDILDDEWTDAGTFETLKYASDILYKVDNKIIL